MRTKPVDNMARLPRGLKSNFDAQSIWPDKIFQKPCAEFEMSYGYWTKC
jgi:hypothetical protein